MIDELGDALAERVSYEDILHKGINAGAQCSAHRSISVCYQSNF
jgi:hypothetical protein